MEEAKDEGAFEETGIPVAGEDENTAILAGTLDHLASATEDQDSTLPAPKDTTKNDKKPISSFQGKTEIPDSDADSEFSSPVKSTSHFYTAATASSPTVLNENFQSPEERSLADRDTASVDGSVILAAGSDPASDDDIVTSECESSPQDNHLDLAIDGIDEVIETQDDTAKEVDSVIELDAELPVITLSSMNEGDTSHIVIDALRSSLPEIEQPSTAAELVFTSSPMDEAKAANAISLAAAAIGTLQEPESANENNARDVMDSFSVSVQKAIVFINQRPLSTSLPELEFFKTDGGHAMEESEESSTQTGPLPTSVVPIDHGAEDHEMGTGIEPLTSTHNPPAKTMLAKRNDGDHVMEGSEATSTRSEILANSAMEPDLKEDPSPTPANLTNNDSQHFDEAWKEIMGTDNVPGSSEQSTQGASSQITTVNAANDLNLLASAQLTGVESADAEHRKDVDAAEGIVYGKREGIELSAAVHQAVFESPTQYEDTPMDTEIEFAPQHESDDSIMQEEPDTSMSDVKRSTPLFGETSSKIPSLGLESNYHQSPAQDTDAEMAEGEGDNQLELDTSRVTVVATDDQKLAKYAPEEIGESQSSRKRVIPDSDDEDEDEQHTEDACVLPSARVSPTRAASPRQATLSMAPILSQSTQPEEPLIPSSPHAEAALLPSEKPVMSPGAFFKLPMMNKDPLSSSPVRQEISSSFPTKTEQQMEASEGPKDVVMEELKAMKIASLKARNATLTAEIESKRAKLEEVTKTLIHPAAETVRTHIKLLHDYNDIRDIGQGLIGMIADNRGVRIGDLYEEFGVDVKD